ncbi:flagellar motor switch phosphatase FliY [Bacillus piscicola]|uniref:flagellar motor switch phosphatase FliY n=1 Tax=Bacillus piscicola TaxID=1632684 RepID=UPI001F09B1A8|nr:flagellar motor switch phosphatase FliY [Bacillus piscicola]
MNDDMLSQEEINELLKSVGADEDEEEQREGAGEGSSPDVPEDDSDTDNEINRYLDPIEQDALGEIGNISFGSAATALSQLLNQKVDITTPIVSIIERKNLDIEFPHPYIAVHVEYTDGFEGTNLLTIHTSDAAIIADLMLGGDGKNPPGELDDMQLSAVQEAMNQMMGSASTSMSTVFNKRVDISPPGIDIMDVKEDEGTSNIPDDEMLVKNSFRLRIGDLIDSSIMQIFTIPFAKQMVTDLMNPVVNEAPPAQAEPLMQEREPDPSLEPPRQPQNKERPAPQPSSSFSAESQTNRTTKGRPEEAQPKQVQPVAFSSFETPSLNESESRNLNMLFDIPLEVTVELGRTQHSIKDILDFAPGSIIELDKLAGEPVDILINQKLTAKGEVVVIDENFGVRITDIVSQSDRLRKLN